MKRAAITGATGMIGSALARCLSAKGIEVLAIVNPGSPRLHEGAADGSPRVSVLPCAGAGYAALAEELSAGTGPRADVFYHFAWSGTLGAARADESRQKASVQMAADAVKLAHALGCTRFVFAGSQAEYGVLDGAFSASTPCHPVTAYGTAKLAAERQTRELVHKLGMEHISCRIGSVYGPGDNDGTVLMQAIRHALEGQPFACTQGEQLWDHLYCGDAAEAFSLVGERGVPGAVYPVGSGAVEPLREHIRLACEAARPGFEPDFGALPYPEGQVMYLRADIAPLRKDTGFEPRVPFSEGIGRTVEWCRAVRAAASGKAREEREGCDADA